MLTTITLDLDTTKYPFRELVEDALGVAELERLHALGPDYDHFTRETDQQTIWHQRFYESIELPEWQKVYEGFVQDVAHTLDHPVVYQRVPTFRVALPGNVSVGEPHRDRDYDHSPNEIVTWVPMTDAKDTSAVWVETTEGSEDYRPVNCTYGQYVLADYSNLKHYNKDNETGKTRVSFDFRIIPMSLYQAQRGKASINTNLPFRLPDFEGEFTYFAYCE